jgi:hypothetical protein
MGKRISIDEWILLHHPEIAVDEAQYVLERESGGCQAWVHLYSATADREYAVRYDDYDAALHEYDLYVSNVKHRENMEKNRRDKGEV